MADGAIYKRVGEDLILTFDFNSQKLFGEVLSAPTVTVDLFSGIDYNPSLILSGSPSILAGIVSQKFVDGMAGVTYLVTATAIGASGTLYVMTRYLSTLADFGSYQPGSVMSLSGVLPNGIVGAPYSSNLAISGGYAPYTPDTPTGVNPPPWMGFQVINDQLNCIGVPDVETTYAFNAVVQDAALTTATSPQTITITRVTITNDMPAGFFGQTVNFQYLISGGTPPYTFITGISGLPTTTSIDASGLVTGEYTAVGTFNWTVLATDANNVLATKPDSAVISHSGMLTWELINTGVAQSPRMAFISDSEVIAIGLNNAIIVFSSNRGNTWNSVGGVFGGPAAGVGGIVKIGGTWFIGADDNSNGIRQCVGDSFGSFTNFANQPAFVQGLSMNVLNGSLFATCLDNAPTYRIWKMNSPGSLWTEFDTGVTKFHSGRSITSTVYTNGRYIFGTDEGKVLVGSSPSGMTGTQLYGGVTISITNARAQGDIVIVSDPGGVGWFRSTDRGDTWSAQQTSPQLRHLSVTPAEFIMGDVNNVLTSPNGAPGTWTLMFNTGPTGTQFVGRHYAKVLSTGPIAIMPRLGGGWIVRGST